MPNWDKKYEIAPHGLFGQAPNAYVRQVATRSDFHSTSALCLADGDGRNSRWLARKGIETTAVDKSSVAIRNALFLDQEAGTQVERIVADLETWMPRLGRRWDAMFLIYFQGPAELRLHAMRVGWAALDPGGWFVLEAFAKTQAARASGPKTKAHLYDLAEISIALSDHHIVEALTERINLDEGARHQGEVDVVRFTARKG